jgi:tricorn protease
MRLRVLAGLAVAASLFGFQGARAAPPHILQTPVISKDLIAFGYAGDVWVVPRAGGRALRLTTGIGVESNPIFSPDGQTIAFTGEYDGNTDVFTIPAAGGIPHRVTYHPAADSAVAWSPDGKRIVFRSDRTNANRTTQLFSVNAQGGPATVLPLPIAYSGTLSPDGKTIAYTPWGLAFGYASGRYVSWGNYKGGQAGTVWLTNLATLDSVEVPHEVASDFSPAYAGGKIYFLSGRKGPIGVFSYDPATKAVAEVFHNTGSDIRSLASDGHTLVFDRLGELYTLEPGGQPKLVQIDVTGDMPDVRPKVIGVADEIQNVGVSPTGLRAVVEAHGEILTAPAKQGTVRNITNSMGSAEREPAWSPDGQSIAYFSDESGLYALHVAAQTGALSEGAKAVKKYPLSPEPAYYFHPVWSPDSKHIAFYDNRLNRWLIDLATGKVTKLGEPDVYGGFTQDQHDVAWSPDSRWIVYPHSAPNGLHVLMLHAVDGSIPDTQLTDQMAEASSPAFDRDGKYLYFLASNNAGMTIHGLDMTSDLYQPTTSIYALALKAGTLSPTAPEAYDEKKPAEAAKKEAEETDKTPAGQEGERRAAAKANPKAVLKPETPKLTGIDLAGLSVDEISHRVTGMPLPARSYSQLQAGKGGTLYFIEEGRGGRVGGPPAADLKRYVIEDRKAETLAERVADYELTADGEKMLVAQRPAAPEGAAGPGGPRQLAFYIVSAKTPMKPGDGRLDLSGLTVRTDPAAEWRQMYHEVWRIERAFFYDPKFHGYDTAAEEKKLEPYVEAVQSRADLNYIFQEMLTGFSVGHLRGFGGAIPSARRVPGGLLGADYVIVGGHWCVAKILTGSPWSPDVKAPLAQPGVEVRAGDCILAINDEAVTADEDIQQPLEGTAGRTILLRLASADGKAPRDVSVTPVASEQQLRNLDWIEANRRKVDQLSGGKLAYVYLPDTGAGGFTNFNRYYFAQLNRQGAVVDERFNAGGQIADYIIEVLGRKLEAWWSPRYGQIDRSPAGSILGPKVMIANEASGSGGDAMPWLFKFNHLGPLVGKRTWGGLVGIGPIPVLMDGGSVTSPSVGFFSPSGQWDVENHGTDPDVVVEQDPKLVAAGHDPQLETAVKLAMDALKANPPPQPSRPAYPNYHGGK